MSCLTRGYRIHFMRNAFTWVIVACAVSIATAQETIPEKATLKASFDVSIRPLLQDYCIKCHGKNTKSDVRLDTLSPEITPQTIEIWTKVKNELDVGAMPPKKEKHRPAHADEDQILSWVGGSLNRYGADHMETGGDTVVRLINHRAWQNMIQTLLDTPAQCMDEFPEDGASYGYDTVGSGLYNTVYQTEMYMKSADQTLDLAIPTPDAQPKVKEIRIITRENQVNGLKGRIERLDTEIKACIADPKRFGGQLMYTNYNRIARDAVTRYYSIRKFEDLAARKIDWANNPKCTDAILAALKEENDKQRALLDKVSDFQPMMSFGGGIMDPFGMNATLDAADAGIYLIRSRMALADPKCPLPVMFVVDDKVVKRFTLYDTENAPGTYEVKLALSKGRHQIMLQPANNTIYFVDHVNALYGMKLGRGDFPTVNYEGTAHPPNVLVSEILLRGPLYATWPSPAAARVFTRGLKAPPTREYAEEIVETFLKRAYGGNYNSDMATLFTDLIMSHYETGHNFVNAVKYGLSAILCSPRFLYLVEERRADPKQRRPLSGFEIARRLAYFLWSDLPDDELVSAAARGALSEEKELLAQTRRMLKYPRSKSFREAFATQWLKIDKLKSVVVSDELFPMFDPALLDSARDESVAYFSELLDKNLSVLNFIDSDFAMLNGRLAVHYGIPGITGNGFRRVALPPNSHRGGVLTQASVLIATSNGMVTSPVRRGVFVMERLLGVSPGTPPPNVPALDRIPPAKPDGTVFSPRERLAFHRENKSCARCHDKIDPLGVGLETYNAIGAWNAKLQLLPMLPPPDPRRGRTPAPKWTEREADLTGSMLDGTPYDGPDELKKRLLKHKDRFVRSLAENLTIYALGRGLELSDRPVLDKICQRVIADNDGLATLVEQVVLSELFRNK